MKCLGIAAEGRGGKLRAASADHVIPDGGLISLPEAQQPF
jgi:hypothetical protein